MIILLIAAFTGIALLDVPNLIKTKKWKELIVFSTLFLGEFTLALLIVIGVDVPSPVKGIEYIIKDILHLNYE